MPYALFSNDERISQAFPTPEAVWMHADEAGLVIDEVSNITHTSMRVLDQGYIIKLCPPDDVADKAA